MEEDRKAFALRLREQAGREAREQGLSGHAAEAHIAQSERDGLIEADAERNRMVAQRRRMAADREVAEQGLTGEAAARRVERLIQDVDTNDVMTNAAENIHAEREWRERQETGHARRALEDTSSDAPANAEPEVAEAASPSAFGPAAAIATATEAWYRPLLHELHALKRRAPSKGWRLAARTDHPSGSSPSL